MLSFYLAMLDTPEQKKKFEAIYTEYESLIYHEAYNLSKNHHTAQDIVHDVALHLIKRIDDLRTENRNELASLIVLITRNKTIDVLRSLGRITVIEDDSAFDSNTPSSEDMALSEIAYEEVYSAIGKLKDTYRIPLTLRAKGYKSSEIAALLSISEETVRVRLHRGRKLLQSKLKQVNS